MPRNVARDPAHRTCSVTTSNRAGKSSSRSRPLLVAVRCNVIDMRIPPEAMTELLPQRKQVRPAAMAHRVSSAVAAAVVVAPRVPPEPPLVAHVPPAAARPRAPAAVAALRVPVAAPAPAGREQGGWQAPEVARVAQQVPERARRVLVLAASARHAPRAAEQPGGTLPAVPPARPEQPLAPLVGKWPAAPPVG